MPIRKIHRHPNPIERETGYRFVDTSILTVVTGIDQEYERWRMAGVRFSSRQSVRPATDSSRHVLPAPGNPTVSKSNSTNPQSKSP